MRAVVLLIYVVMGVWLLLAAGLRIALQLGEGLDLDPLPFVSGGLGLLALIALAPASVEWRRRHPSDS